MSKSANKQMLAARKRRFIFALVAFAWLNVNAAPCLMAMELPQAVDQGLEHGGHGGQHMAHMAKAEDSGRDGCGHCPPAGATSHQAACAVSVVPGCDEVGRIDFDGRTVKLQLKDLPAFFVLIHAPPAQISPRPVLSSVPMTCVRARFIDGPSINLRNCVFLK